jgi:hypothetical protein
MTYKVCVNFLTFESQECSVLVARVRLDDRGIVVRFLARAGAFSPHSFQTDPDSMHLVPGTPLSKVKWPERAADF